MGKFLISVAWSLNPSNVLWIKNNSAAINKVTPVKMLSTLMNFLIELIFFPGMKGEIFYGIKYFE